MTAPAGPTAAPPEAVAQDWAAKWGSDPRVRSLAALAPRAPTATMPAAVPTPALGVQPYGVQRPQTSASSAPSALHIPSVEDVFGSSVPRRVQPAPATLPPDERHQQDRATADAPTTRGIKDWKPSADSGDLGPSQFGPEAQATGVAASICGPIAAVQFAAAYGRAPSVAEAVALAKQGGNWDAGTGMHGPGSEASLLDSMGVPNRLDTAPSKDAVIRDVTTGNPVILSSPNYYHYFVASGYDPSTGLFDTGNTGEALKGGSRWRSWDDIAPQAALFVDEPSTPVHSQAVDPTTMGGVRREQQAQDANQGSPAAAMRTADQSAYDAYDTPEAREAFVRDRSARYGIDPNVAVAVVKSEGGFDSWNRQSDYVNNGVREPSYGPLQLYMNGGLGNAFMSETGLDPRDPANGPAATDWALRYAAQHGWGDWHGAQRIGLDNYAGINGNPANLPPADVPGGPSGGRGPGMAAPLPRDNPAGPYTDQGANPSAEEGYGQPDWTDPTLGYGDMRLGSRAARETAATLGETAGAVRHTGAVAAQGLGDVARAVLAAATSAAPTGTFAPQGYGVEPYDYGVTHPYAGPDAASAVTPGGTAVRANTALSDAAGGAAGGASELGHFPVTVGNQVLAGPAAFVGGRQMDVVQPPQRDAWSAERAPMPPLPALSAAQQAAISTGTAGSLGPAPERIQVAGPDGQPATRDAVTYRTPTGHTVTIPGGSVAIPINQSAATQDALGAAQDAARAQALSTPSRPPLSQRLGGQSTEGGRLVAAMEASRSHDPTTAAGGVLMTGLQGAGLPANLVEASLASGYYRGGMREALDSGDGYVRAYKAMGASDETASLAAFGTLMALDPIMYIGVGGVTREAALGARGLMMNAAVGGAAGAAFAQTVLPANASVADRLRYGAVGAVQGAAISAIGGHPEAPETRPSRPLGTPPGNAWRAIRGSDRQLIELPAERDWRAAQSLAEGVHADTLAQRVETRLNAPNATPMDNIRQALGMAPERPDLGWAGIPRYAGEPEFTRHDATTAGLIRRAAEGRWPMAGGAASPTERAVAEVVGTPEQLAATNGIPLDAKGRPLVQTLTDGRSVISASLGDMGVNLARRMGIDLGPGDNTVPVHLAVLTNLGYNPDTRTFGVLDRLGIAHEVLATHRSGRWGGSPELNVRVALPEGTSVEQSRAVAALLGRYGLQDAVGILHPLPEDVRRSFYAKPPGADRLPLPSKGKIGITRALEVRKPDGSEWTPDEMDAMLDATGGLGFDQSADGKALAYVDYDHVGGDYILDADRRVNAAAARAGIDLHGTIVYTGHDIVEAPSYGAALSGLRPTRPGYRPTSGTAGPSVLYGGSAAGGERTLAEHTARGARVRGPDEWTGYEFPVGESASTISRVGRHPDYLAQGTSSNDFRASLDAMTGVTARNYYDAENAARAGAAAAGTEYINPEWYHPKPEIPGAHSFLRTERDAQGNLRYVPPADPTARLVTPSTSPQGHATYDQIVNAFRERDPLNAERLTRIMGAYGDYLRDPEQFFTAMRDRVDREGFNARDVAKAYITALASQRAGEMSVDTYLKKAPAWVAEGFDRPSIVDPTKTVREMYAAKRVGGKDAGKWFIRPEATAFVAMESPFGRRVLDAIENGTADDAMLQEFVKFRDPQGSNIVANAGLGKPEAGNELSDAVESVARAEGRGRRKPKVVNPDTQAFNLRNLRDSVAVLNAARSDPALLDKTFRRMGGIGVGKSPFIGSWLGYAEQPTLDAREVNVHMAGHYADDPKYAGKVADRARWDDRAAAYRAGEVAYYASNHPDTFGTEARDAILKTFREYTKATGVGEHLPDSMYGGLMHWLLWDRSMGEMTEHGGIPQAMLHPLASDARPVVGRGGITSFHDERNLDRLAAEMGVTRAPAPPPWRPGDGMEGAIDVPPGPSYQRMYHGSPTGDMGSGPIDPARLQTRDPGVLGRGLYVGRRRQTAERYVDLPVGEQGWGNVAYQAAIDETSAAYRAVQASLPPDARDGWTPLVQARMHGDWRTIIDTMRARGEDTSALQAATRRYDESVAAVHDVQFPNGGPNIRPVDVPSDARLLNLDTTADKALYRRLFVEHGGDRDAVNAALREQGYDGIQHSGKTAIPVYVDPSRRIGVREQLVGHEQAVIFPESLSKIRNAISKQPEYLPLSAHPLFYEPRDLTPAEQAAAGPAGVAAGTGPSPRTQATAKRIVQGAGAPDLGTSAGVRTRKTGADTPSGLDLALTRAQAVDRPNAERLLASVADQYERLSPARAEAATAAVKAAWTKLHGAENADLFDAFLPYADAMNARNRVTMTFVGPKALLALADRGIFTNLASVAKDYPALADMHAGSVGAERYVKAIEKLRKGLTPEQIKARGFDLTDAQIERLGGRDFVQRLHAADTAAFGATNVPTNEAYAMDPLGTQRLYAYQTLGQPEIGDYHGALGDPKGLNVGLAWRDRARGEEGPFYVSSLLHHFAETSPQYPIHGSMGKLFQKVLWAPDALEGERGATLFGPMITPTAKTGIDVGQGRFMGKTNLLVGPNAADRAQSLNLLLGMSKDTPAAIALREGRITTPEDLYAALSAGGTGQNNPLYRRYNMALGLKENAAVPEEAKANLGLSYTPNRTRQEALILDPHPEGIKYFYARGTHDELMNTVIPGAGESGRPGRTTFDVLRDAQDRAGGPDRAPIVLYDQTVPLDASGAPAFPEARDIPSHARIVNPDGSLGPTLGEALPDVAPDRPNLRRSYTGLGLVSIDAAGNRVPVRNMGQVDVQTALLGAAYHGLGGAVAGAYGAATAPEGSTPRERLDRAMQYAPYGVAGAAGALALGGGAALAAKSLSRGGPHVATLGSNLVKGGDTLRSFYAANLMSNPASQFRNITSNILSLATQPIESELSAANFGIARRWSGYGNVARTRYGHQEIKASAAGSLRGAVDGFNTMMEILASGETAAPTAWSRAMAGNDISDLSRVTNGGRTVVNQLPGGTLNPLNSLVLRPMTATDEFFKGLIYHQAVNTEFYRLARARGLKGAQADRAVTQYFMDIQHRLQNKYPIPDEMRGALERAGKYARYQTFQQQMDQVGKGLTMIQKIPVIGSFLMPFTRTPYNILKYGLERSPLGGVGILTDVARGVYNPASDLAKAHPEQLRDVGDLADRMARFELGVGFMAASAGLYQAGILTGAAPTDKGEAAAWRLAGNKEFSIHIPGTDLFIPMLQIPSLGPTMAATVGVLDARAKQMQDAAKHPDEPPPSLLEQGARAFDGAVASMQQQGFAQSWQALASLIDGVSGRQGAPSENLQSPLNRQLGSIATGLVPGSAAMRAVTSAPEPVTVGGRTVIPATGDQYDRQTPGILDDPQAIIPPAAGALGVPNASQLRPQSVLGRPIPRQRRNVLDTLFNPLSVVGDRTDAVDRELSALGIQVPGAGSTVEGQKLTQEQRNAYEDAIGQQVRPPLEALLNKGQYTSAPPKARETMVKGVIDENRQEARLELLASGAEGLPTMRDETRGEPYKYDPKSLLQGVRLPVEKRVLYLKNPDAFQAAVTLAALRVARWEAADEPPGPGRPSPVDQALADLASETTPRWDDWNDRQQAARERNAVLTGALPQG